MSWKLTVKLALCCAPPLQKVKDGPVVSHTNSITDSGESGPYNKEIMLSGFTPDVLQILCLHSEPRWTSCCLTSMEY